MKIKIKKSVFKQVAKLPKRVQVLYHIFLSDLQRDGLNIQGWNLKKMQGSQNTYRVKLNKDYRVILQFIKPDLIIVKVASREGIYK